MASNPHGHRFELIVNGHKFFSEKQFITGKEILLLVGLNPEDPFEILFRLNGKELEPVELNETKDLAQPGLERFEVRPLHQLTILVDDEKLVVPKCFMTPIEILELAGKKPGHYYLKQILGHAEITYKNDEQHVIAIVCNMKFSTFKKGPATVS